MAKRKNRQRILNINRMKKRLCDKEEDPIDFGDAVVSEETEENDTPRIVAEKTETTNEDESLPTSSVKKRPTCRRELKMLSSTSRIQKYPLLSRQIIMLQQNHRRSVVVIDL